LCAELNTLSANNLGTRIVRFPHFNSLFVHTEYTSNMAAGYCNDVMLIRQKHRVRCLLDW